jgi:fatty-acyl-CoA synthase
VLQAAAIGVAHPKWDERPVLALVLRDGKSVTAAEMSAYLKDKIPSWWMPDRVVIVAELPLTATGKINKVALREQYRDCLAEPPH